MLKELFRNQAKRLFGLYKNQEKVFGMDRCKPCFVVLLPNLSSLSNFSSGNGSRVVILNYDLPNQKKKSIANQSIGQ